MHSTWTFRKLMLALALGGVAAHAVPAIYTLNANAAALTNIAVDGKCNLVEAFASVNQGSPINADCQATFNFENQIILNGPAAYQVGGGVSLTTTVYTKLEARGSGVSVEGTGMPLIVGPQSSLNVFHETGSFTIKHTGATAARAVNNAGILNARNVIFGGGDISGQPTSLGYGGVIYNAGELVLTSVTLENGKAVHGGGVYLNGGFLSASRCTIRNNTATKAGGGIYNRFTDSHLTHSTIQDNTAGERGGGIYNQFQTIELDNCAVKGNKAGQGGGMFHNKPTPGENPQLYIDNTTFSDNKAIATEVSVIPLPSGASATVNEQTCSNNEGATQAFDDDFGTKWCSYGAQYPSLNFPRTLTYDFAGTATQVVSAYSITSANDSYWRDPADWTFEGYNGTDWIVLHTVTNATWRYPNSTFDPKRFLTRTFGPTEGTNAFVNTTAYQSYRLRVTANLGSYPGGTPTYRVQLAELQLYLDGKTGDGGGIYTMGHMNLTNNTFSGNIAGCTSSSCSCTSAWCATTSNTSAAMGKGGALYGGNPPPEALMEGITVAGNSASQGGGVYQDYFDHWSWGYSLFGYNKARAANSPEPDFHGDPHDDTFLRKGCFFTNSAGINVFPAPSTEGLKLTGNEPDYVGDPKLNALADNGGLVSFFHTWTHELQSTSPALNKVPAGQGPAADQRGTSRPQGTAPDMGAYERVP